MAKSIFSRRMFGYPLSTKSTNSHQTQNQQSPSDDDHFTDIYPVVTASSSVYSDHTNCIRHQSPESSLYSFRISGGLQIPPKSSLRTYHSLANIRMGEQTQEAIQIDQRETASLNDNEAADITLEEFPYQKLYNDFSDDTDSSDNESLGNRSITDASDYLSTEDRHNPSKSTSHRAKFSVATEAMIRSFEQELSAFDHLGEIVPIESSGIAGDKQKNNQEEIRTPDTSSSSAQTFTPSPLAYSSPMSRSRTSPSVALRRKTSIAGTFKTFKSLKKRIISGGAASPSSVKLDTSTGNRSPTINMRFWSENFQSST